MATATMPRAGEFKPEYGQTETIAFKFLEGKVFDGAYGVRVMFTLTDERKLWVDHEDGHDIQTALREFGIKAGEPVTITKVKYPTGGGHAYRVRSAVNAAKMPAAQPQAAEPSRLERQLEESVALARREGPAAFQRNAHVQPAAPAEPAAPANHATAQLTTCFHSAIDAISAAQGYADTKGLKVTFTSEDVRCVAISNYIQMEKALMGARY